MRRGLLTWDANELPLSSLEARVVALRAAMKAKGLDALLAYTNISRPAAVSWMSGFTPYWSEGLFYLPNEGEAAFATALSKRVAEWISTVMPSGEIIPTPAPGTAIGKRLAASGAKRVGIVDLDDVPARQAHALTTEAAGLELIDATDLFNAIRCNADDAERALVRKAAQIAADCMKLADANAANAQMLIAACEGYARKNAAEEIFLAVAPDLTASPRYQRTDTAAALGKHFALRISLAYKAGWVRNAQSFSSDPSTASLFDAARKAFDAVKLSTDQAIEPQLRAALESANAKVTSWSIEQPRGSYPLVPVAGSAIAANTYKPGSPCVLNVECDIQGNRWLASRPVF